MKKILRLTSSVLVGTFSIFILQAQQQIPNSGFENWENVGTNTEEPLNWNSNKTGTDYATLPPKTISRESSIVHSGSYSAKIKTESFGTTVNGVMTTGRVNAPTFSASDGYNDTRTDNNNFNCPLTHYPDSIVLWAHYTQGNGTDRARVAATIHDNYNQRDPYANDPNGSENVVANATLNFPTTNGWQRISIPFDYATYASNNKVPAYILVNLTSSNVPGSGSTSSVLYVDDLELIYNPNTVTIAPEATQYLLVDEAGTQLEATETPNAESASATISREWKYSTTSGSGYVSFASAETGTTYTPQFNAVGTYYVVCESNFDGETVTSNEVEIIVSETIPNIVQIAPTATQNISVSADGTPLSATETPDAATSREWKYTTTSGSGYMSFITDEFALTYTPNFATAGTYYVVCVSEINGETVTSNEVQINVTDGTSSLGELTQEHIVIYQTESNLVVDLSKASVNDVDMNLYNMDGRLVHSSKLSNNGQNIIQIDFPVGIYVMTLSTDKGVYQQKVYVK